MRLVKLIIVLFVLIMISICLYIWTSKTYPKKTLVLYVFHQYNNRVEQFINHCIFKADDVDFVMICNDPSFDLSSRVPSYVKTHTRENIGYDFGAWSDGLITHNYAYKPYDYYIFANSSIFGPYMDNHKNKRWTDVFIEGLTKSDDMKLFGVTINSFYKTGDLNKEPHVQSYLYAMRQETVHDLIEDGLFSTSYVKTFDEAVEKEVGMSRLIIKRGGNIGSLLSCYKGVDWRKPNAHINYLQDIMFNSYKNKVWTLNELVFVKGNRDIDLYN